MTRTDDAAFDEVRARIPEARFNELGRLIHADRRADRTESAELLTGLVLAT
ncbi:MAG: hypothetical protein IIC93_10845, partial [Chloroflexi bacterium]|nr:hypothetical protein [Chloroflexota bacterium]